MGGRFEARIAISKKEGSPSYAKIIGKPHAYKRSSISIREGPKSFYVEIQANDPVALRASMNAMMRQIQVIESVTAPDFRKSPAKSKSKNI